MQSREKSDLQKEIEFHKQRYLASTNSRREERHHAKPVRPEESEAASRQELSSH